MIWATGDCHGNFERFRPEYFPKNAIFNVVAFGSAHGEEAISLQLVYLPPHQMQHMRTDAVYFTALLQEVRERAKSHYWLFGHYHDNRAIDEKHILLWEQIVRVI